MKTTISSTASSTVSIDVNKIEALPGQTHIKFVSTDSQSKSPNEPRHMTEMILDDAGLKALISALSK